MPLTAAAGPISLAQVALARSLAACPAFQEFLEYGGVGLGSDPAAAALLRIHHDEVPQPPADGDEYSRAELEAIRPYALTATGRQGAFRLTRRATGTYRDAGKLHLALLRDVTQPERGGSSAEVIRVFQNQIGSILSELCELSDDTSEAYLIVQECLVTAHWRSHEDDAPKMGDFLCAQVDLVWGAE